MSPWLKALCAVRFKAAINRMQLHDVHATILLLLGIDHAKLTYRSASRDFSLTVVHGSVPKAILA